MFDDFEGTISDKIFIATDNKVRGYNRKGKLFLSFDTNLTESIKSMFVSGTDLIVCGNHVYNHYRDCKEIGSYLCGDTIVDIAALNPNNTSRIITALACSGRVLRLLEHCRVRQSIELESVPTILHIPKCLGDKIICGFADGRVILFRIALGIDVTQQILVDNIESTNAAVTCIDTYDISGDGNDDLLIGRRDGIVQVFTMNSDENEIAIESQQIFKEACNESISSIQGGCISTNGYTEIIICTYSGRIFGLTTQCISRSLSDKNQLIPLNDTNNRIMKLQTEILELERNVLKEREKYQMSTQAISSGLSAIPILNINDSMILQKEDASYLLSIEIPISIENILLQSDVPIDLLDVDKNSAVVSFSECEPLTGNFLLATYRCQLNTNRIDLKFRTIEGQHGHLQIYITPILQPKCCQLKRYQIHPLSLHINVQNFENKRPYNCLILKGTFSQAEMHNWLSNCLPEIPEKMQSSERCMYTFLNVFVGTYLICDYSKGNAEFKTDNISTISILKDFLTKEATKRRIKLEISTNIIDASISHMLTLIEPKLLFYIKLMKDYKLLQSLIDLDIRNDEERNSLNSYYRDLLNTQNDIINEHKRESTILDRLYGLLTDLYMDRYKLKGINNKTKIPELIQLLDNYERNEIVKFYGGKINDDKVID